MGKSACDGDGGVADGGEAFGEHPNTRAVPRLDYKMKIGRRNARHALYKGNEVFDQANANARRVGAISHAVCETERLLGLPSLRHF